MRIGPPTWLRLGKEVEMEPYHSRFDDEEDKGPDVDDMMGETDLLGVSDFETRMSRHE